MSLLQTVKAAQLSERKARNAIAAASLTTLIGEAEAIGKNSGNRDVTDAEVVALLKKFIKNNAETHELLSRAAQVLGTGDARLLVLTTERTLFESFLPKQLGEVELRAVIVSIVGELDLGAKPKIGDVLKSLKFSHEGTYDGALASKIVKEYV